MASILTTESVPPRHRADYWEEMVSRQFVPARCVPNARAGFSARIRSLDVDAVTLSDVRSHGTDVLRTAGHVSQSDRQYFLLSLQQVGIGRVEQAGRTVFLQPGDMVLYDTARAYGLRFAAAQQQLVLRMPREALVARCPAIASRVGIALPAQTPAARLIRDLARSLAALDDLPPTRSRGSLALTLIDLVLDGLLALDPPGRARPVASRRAEAQRIARRQLADPTFSVARWAAAVGVSERYLRMLFEGTRQSPARYLWTQRLERAAAALRDPACCAQSITEIALGCGFGDSAHFSHAFRAAYGQTPRQYRGPAQPASQAARR